MPDPDLRDLDRAARAGDLDAGVALLRARVRGGLLPERRVHQAAYLGHEAARTMTGICCWAHEGKRSTFARCMRGIPDRAAFRNWVQQLEWIGTLDEKGEAPDTWFVARCALAAGRRCLGSRGDGDAPYLRAPLEDLEAWLENPDEDRREACRIALPHSLPLWACAFAMHVAAPFNYTLGWAMGAFGSAAEVVAPIHLVEAVRNIAGELLAPRNV